MINPQVLQDNIVTLLRAIPELVDFIGDVGEIQAYDDESQVSGNVESAEFSMMGRALMVFWTGAELPRMGETRGWKHQFKIALKAESIQAYYQMAQFIFDGVPVQRSTSGNFDDTPGNFDSTPGLFDDGGGTSSGVSNINGFDNLLNCVINPNCDGIQDAEILPERSADGIGRLAITFAIHEY